MSGFRKYSAIFIFSVLLPVFISGCGAQRSRLAPRVITSKQDPLSRMVPIPILPIETEYKPMKIAEYTVGVGDVLSVFMWRHPDLSTDVTVRPDGKISYLLIGDVQAEGLTVPELDDVITEKFEKFAVEQASQEMMEAPLKEEYKINLGDELSVSVWKEPDFDTKLIVRPDGRISFPLTGDIMVYGKSLPEADEILTEKLSEYVKDPHVSMTITRFGILEGQQYIAGFISMYVEEKPDISVIVTKFGSRKVIVLGQVSSPAIYDLEGNARLFDAIAYAGGFTDNAVRDNVFVIRGDVFSEPTVIKVNAWDIIRRGNYALNIVLQDQDIVYVPRSIVGNYNVLIQQLQPTATLLKDTLQIQQDFEILFKTN